MSIAAAGAITPLIALAREAPVAVKVEAIAALANLAVNDENEVQIAESGGLKPIMEAAHSSDSELVAQCARAMRNLSVHGA